MMKRFLPLFLFFLGSGLFILNILVVIQVNKINNRKVQYSPIANEKKESPEADLGINEKFLNSDLFDKNVLNILLLGIDRRSKFEYSYRTDIMILLSVNVETNKVTLVSVPRDLWYQGQRVNATYITQGFDELSDAFYEITGLKTNKYILTDFEDFSWIVDAMGGVPVTVERSFIDSSYPVDATLGYQTISFTQGPEKLTGERALIYSRSRKGSNGEGSDWARMRRQHLILRGMIDAIVQPGNLFNPMNVEKAFNHVTEGRMDTNLSIEDSKFLWDMYKDKDKYEIHSLFLDSTYVYSPPMQDYGGAWVLVSADQNYESFKKDLRGKLYDEEIEENEADLTVNSAEQETTN
jgi:LCP family protein required for cell wall assembly